MNEQNIYDKLFHEEEPINFHKRGLKRSSTDFIISGVCSGIAKYLNINPMIIRLIALLLLILGWFTLYVYLLLTFFIPLEKKEAVLSSEEFINISKENIKTTLGSMLLITGLYLIFQNFSFNFLKSFFLYQNEFLTYSFAFVLGLAMINDKLNFSTIYFNNPVNLKSMKKNKLILGVCSGLAKYLSIDVTTLRVVFILLFFLTLGLFSIFYLLIYMFSKHKSVIINDK